MSITNINTGIVEYNFKNTDILSVGVHVAWVVFTLSDGRIGKSDPKQFTVVEEGKIII